MMSSAGINSYTAVNKIIYHRAQLNLNFANPETPAHLSLLNTIIHNCAPKTQEYTVKDRDQEKFAIQNTENEIQGISHNEMALCFHGCRQ